MDLNKLAAQLHTNTAPLKGVQAADRPKDDPPIPPADDFTTGTEVRAKETAIDAVDRALDSFGNAAKADKVLLRENFNIPEKFLATPHSPLLKKASGAPTLRELARSFSG